MATVKKFNVWIPTFASFFRKAWRVNTFRRNRLNRMAAIKKLMTFPYLLSLPFLGGVVRRGGTIFAVVRID